MLRKHVMNKRIAIYPGSFDPFTNGHLDILRRALLIFESVIVAVNNGGAKHCLLDLDERVALIRSAVPHLKRVRVEKFSGLLVEYAAQKKASAIIRGLRAVSDFEYEFQLALMNRKLARQEHFETVYLMPDEKYTYLSSSLVKEVARLGGDIRAFVPRNIEKKLTAVFRPASKPYSVKCEPF